MSAIPIGAYEPQEINQAYHANPYEAVQMHKDLQSRLSVAIHWGTFRLGEEDDPPQELDEALQQERGDMSPFVVLEHGETVTTTATIMETNDFGSNSIEAAA